MLRELRSVVERRRLAVGRLDQVAQQGFDEIVEQRSARAEHGGAQSTLQKGQQPAVNDTKQYNNGVKVVPAQLLTPVIVTKANAKEAYANDPTLLAIVNAAG